MSKYRIYLPYDKLPMCLCTYRVSNETIMRYWLVEHSPLTVSVNARAWQDYDGKLYS